MSSWAAKCTLDTISTDLIREENMAVLGTILEIDVSYGQRPRSREKGGRALKPGWDFRTLPRLYSLTRPNFQGALSQRDKRVRRNVHAGQL